jgi:hypothetical protein
MWRMSNAQTLIFVAAIVVAVVVWTGATGLTSCRLPTVSMTKGAVEARLTA